MKTLIIVLFFIALTSCSSIKFKDVEMDVTQELKGSIKEIRWKTFYYNTKYTDSMIRQQDILVSYDKKYNTLKQIVFYPKGEIEEIYYYNSKGLLENVIVKYTKSVSKTQYTYDQKNNMIKYNWYTNDTLNSSKFIKYDKKNNPIERKLIKPNYPKSNWSERITNDYKSRTAIVQGIDENGKDRNTYSKTTYNKNGFIIKMESFNKNNISTSTSVLEYDAQGNLTTSKSYNENGKINSILTAKNIYDKTGNIVLRERFTNGKLFEKTMLEIVYN